MTRAMGSSRLSSSSLSHPGRNLALGVRHMLAASLCVVVVVVVLGALRGEMGSCIVAVLCCSAVLSVSLLLLLGANTR